jgi:hypothetical protein
VHDPQQAVIYRTPNQCCGSALISMRIWIRIRIQHFLSMNADPCGSGSATLHQIPANCTSYFTHITDNARNEESRVLIPVNKRLLVQGVRSGGEEGGLPRPAAGGTPVPVLLTQLLPKQRRFLLSQSYPAYRSPFIWLSWIRIRSRKADPDSGAWNQTKIYKETWLLAFQKGFCAFVGMFFELLPTLSIFFM